MQRNGVKQGAKDAKRRIVAAHRKGGPPIREACVSLSPRIIGPPYYLCPEGGAVATNTPHRILQWSLVGSGSVRIR